MSNIIIGALCVIYGIYTLVYRQIKPEKFTKMQAMQRVYGEKAGYVVHVITYSVIPLVLGIACLVLYLVYGVAVFTPKNPGSLLS